MLFVMIKYVLFLGLCAENPLNLSYYFMFVFFLNGNH